MPCLPAAGIGRDHVYWIHGRQKTYFEMRRSRRNVIPRFMLGEKIRSAVDHDRKDSCACPQSDLGRARFELEGLACHASCTFRKKQQTGAGLQSTGAGFEQFGGLSV